LVLELDQSLDAPAPPGPAGDQASSSARVPRSVTIVLARDRISLSTRDAASLDVYGVAIRLTPEEITVVGYDNVTRDLTVPLVPAVRTSTLAAPEGVATIEGAAWAIPVAFTVPENLGQALGPGAIRLLLGSGLSVQIPPLDLTVPIRQVSVSVGLGLLEITG